jgi:hypothetical protein
MVSGDKFDDPLNLFAVRGEVAQPERAATVISVTAVVILRFILEVLWGQNDPVAGGG